MERKLLGMKLRDAASVGSLEHVRDCLAKGADVNQGNEYYGNTPLHYAALRGYPDIVRLLLKIEDLDPNKMNVDGKTPFDVAADEVRLDIVILLLEKTAIDSKKVLKDGNNVLHRAASRGELELVLLLLEKSDIDPNQKNKYGDTLLHLAVESENIELVILLLERTNIDPAEKNQYGDTLLHLAVESENIELVILLLEKTNIDPAEKNQDRNTAFDLAAENNSFSLVKLLLERTAIDPTRLYKDGKTVLHKAASKGEITTVQLLLKILNIDQNQKNEVGDTLLHSAVRANSYSLVKLLLEITNIDPSEKNKNGNTPFDLAAEKGYFRIVDVLLRRTTIDPTRVYEDGNTALHKTVKKGDVELVKSLLEISNIDPNQKNKYGDTVLHKAAMIGDLELVKLLLEISTIDPNLKNKVGNTPFDLAAEEGRFVIAKLLLGRTTIDPIRVYKYGDTVLHKAAMIGDLELVKLLLEISTIDPNLKNKDSENILQLAVIAQNIELVELLLEGTDIDQTEKNKNGENLLHLAARGESIYLVKLLLERTKIDPAEKNKNGDNLLHVAVHNNNIELVNLILDRTKLDPAKQNKNGNNLLHSAVSGENIELVKLLLERTNIDPTETNQNGDNLLHLAVDRKNVELFNLLLERTNIDPAEKNQANRTPSDTMHDHWFPQDKEKEFRLLLTTYLNKVRNVPKDTPIDMQQDESEQETTENDTVKPDPLFPFAGTSEEFSKLLSTGTYESFENRVFLCGSCACGKSTLASVLIGSPIPLTWKSTDGLVIHFGRNGINLETFEMVPLHRDDRGQNVLTKVVIGKPNRETTTYQSSDSHHDQHIAQSSLRTGKMESNTTPIRKEANLSSTDYKSSDDSISKSQNLTDTKTITAKIKTAPSINLSKIKKIEAYAVRDDILKEVKSGEYKIKIAPSDLVDFGGQRSYDMTHQLFVQHGGTFVVMFNGSEDFYEPLKEYPTGDISNESIVKHWVHSILTYCSDDNDVMPMILFAATHSDLLSEDLQKKMKKDFVKKVTAMFGTHEKKKHFVFDPVFFINGTDENDLEIQNLKTQLVSIARNQPSWGLRRPMIWVPLELLISNMKKDNVNIIFKSHLAEANKMNGDLALSDKQLDDFLLTQHALGKIMYFNQPELDNFVILYPPALVNILRSFITDELFWPEDEILRQILRNMTDTGKIYKKDLLKLWQQRRFHTHIPDDDFKEFVIQVLIHLDVLVLPKRYSVKSDTHVDYFLVPCTVKNRMPMTFLDDKSFASRTLSLVYRLQTASIPPALSFKLIGAVSSIWPIMELDGRPLLYHSSAVLCVDGKTVFRMIVEETKVIVYLTHVSSKSSISPDIAASIQECLTSTLEVVLKFYLSSVGQSHQIENVSNLFQIEVGEVCSRSPCMVSISKAKLNSGWVCSSGNEHSSRHPLLWFFNKTQEECPPNCPGLEKAILTTSPTEVQLSRFATHLTNNSCRELMIHLGLQRQDWEDIEDCNTGMSLIIRIMVLNFWKTKRIKGKPTKSFQNLLDALTAVGDQRHLLCKVFREDTDLLDIADVRLQEVPHDDVLNGLPKHLGNCAIQLGIELGITMSSINETMVRHHKDMYKQISDILGKWKSSRELKPTIYRLMLALERVDIGGLDYLKDKYFGQ